MQYHRLRFRLFSLILTWGLALASGNAAALSTDSEQPLTIKASHASIDDLKGITVYRGNVEVIQGSMRIYADVVTLSYRHEDGDRLLETVTAEGSPARFRQRPDKRDEDIEAQARRMEYYVQKNLLHLLEAAQVRQGQDTFSGPYIVYDSRRSVLTAGGGEGRNPDQRIEVTFHPKKNSAPTEKQEPDAADGPETSSSQP